MGNSLKTLIAKWWLKAKGLVSKDALRLQKNVWLTFDDGPQPQNTELILETLEQHKLKATFFFIGKYVEQYPDIVLRVAEAGHRIGNHTHSHPHLSKLSADAVKAEIEKAERLIAPYQGPGSKLFRPPFGDRNRTVDSIVRKLGYRLVMWTVDTKDWRSENQPRGWMEYGI
ncbi:MAG: polysaccharide deacetylase family protein, partial [Aestuariivirga sp.]